MPADAFADMAVATPAVRTAKRSEAPLGAAATLTADLVRRAKTPLKLDPDASPMVPQPAIQAVPAEAAQVQGPRPTASAVPPAIATPVLVADPAVRHDESAAAARALRRDLNAARRSGGLLRSSGLFLVIYAISVALMIYLLV